MRISFLPQRRDDAMAYSVSGDVLTINGVEFDFTPLEDGAILPRDAIASEWIAEDVTRIEGEVHVKLILPHGPAPTPEQAFPEDVVL